MGAVILPLHIRAGIPHPLVMAPAEVGCISPAANEGKELLLILDVGHRGRQRQRMLLGGESGDGFPRCLGRKTRRHDRFRADRTTASKPDSQNDHHAIGLHE